MAVLVPKRAEGLASHTVVCGSSAERTSLNTEYSWSRAGATDLRARSSSISPLCDKAPIALRLNNHVMSGFHVENMKQRPMQKLARLCGHHETY